EGVPRPAAGVHGAGNDRHPARAVAAQPERQDRSQGAKQRIPRGEALTAPRHSTAGGWPVVDDCLVVGGIPLPQLAERVGRTPFYAYDRRAIDARVGELRRHLPMVKLHYAMKANPMPALVGVMAGIVDGIDV